MKISRPQVSVIIPNYNHAQFLDQRLNSILAQTFRDYEIIFLDDASTDNSLAHCRNYSSLSNFQIVKNAKNSGCAFKQWNKGVQLAQGEYIWIAESDDSANPKLLKRLVDILNQNPNVGIAYCQSYCINENDDIIENHLNQLKKLDRNLWQSDFIMSGKEMLSAHMVAVNTIPNASAVLFRKNLYNRVGGAEENLRLCGDWMTWAKMLMKQGIGFIADPMNYFRIHDSTVRSSMHLKPKYLIEYTEVVKFIIDNVTVSLSAKRKALQQLKLRWLRICLNRPGKLYKSELSEVISRIRLLFGKRQALIFEILGIIALLLSYFGVVKLRNLVRQRKSENGLIK